MAIRYIADTHFGHKNVMKYDNRPWQDVQTMEVEMARLWNEAVSADDIVYILGDVVWSKKADEYARILGQLNGTKIVIKGNHDKSDVLTDLADRQIIQHWSRLEVVKDSDRFVVLSHFPILSFENMLQDNWYHLYGHVHITWDWEFIQKIKTNMEEHYGRQIKSYNVGCMIPGIDYVPRTLDEIVCK